MPQFTFTMSENQARNIHKVVDSHCSALKNHIATAVETARFDDATTYVAQLRQYQAIYAAFNINAKQEIAAFTGKPVETDVTVQNTRD